MKFSISPFLFIRLSFVIQNKSFINNLLVVQNLKMARVFDLCSDVFNSEECQTKSFSLLNVCFFQSHF